MSPPVSTAQPPNPDDGLADVLRTLRYLAPFAQPHRLPKWTVERSYRLWSIAWRHRLPAPRRAPAIESTTTPAAGAAPTLNPRHT